jgi:hypothetical protein
LLCCLLLETFCTSADFHGEYLGRTDLITHTTLDAEILIDHVELFLFTSDGIYRAVLPA